MFARIILPALVLAGLTAAFVFWRPKPADPDLRAEVAALRAEVQALKEDETKKRLALLASLLNENLAALQAGDDDFLFVDRDYRIGRMPKHLKLSPQDEAWMRAFLVR